MRRNLLLQNTPPEWNVRILTQDDFDYYCDQNNIAVRERPLEQAGLYVHGDGQPIIYLNDELRGAERQFVAVHELAHHLLGHPSAAHMYHARDAEEDEQFEIEADIVAICWMIPATMLPHYHASEIVDLYGYTREQIEFRREVFDKYKI